jgi:hypothetical protein
MRDGPVKPLNEFVSSLDQIECKIKAKTGSNWFKVKNQVEFVLKITLFRIILWHFDMLLFQRTPNRFHDIKHTKNATVSSNRLERHNRIDLKFTEVCMNPCQVSLKQIFRSWWSLSHSGRKSQNC